MSLPQNQTEKLANIFGALSHRTKLEIYRHLLDHDAHSTEPLVPTMVATVLEMTVSTTAYNMKALHRAGLLHRHESGRYVFYTVDKESIALIKEFFE